MSALVPPSGLVLPVDGRPRTGSEPPGTGAVDQLFGLILVNMYFVLPQLGTGFVYGLSTVG